MYIARPLVGAPAPTERVTEHLLDGQQRLTALWRALHDDYDDRIYLVGIESNEDGDPATVVRAQPTYDKKGKRYSLWLEDPADCWKRDWPDSTGRRNTLIMEVLLMATMRERQREVQHVPKWGDERGNAMSLIRAYLWRSFTTGRYEGAAATRALQDLRGLIAELRGGTNSALIFDEELYHLPLFAHHLDHKPPHRCQASSDLPQRAR